MSPNFPNKKYNVIYADPPWRYDNVRTGSSLVSGAASKYPTMPLHEIMSLPVQRISEDDCVLFLWSTVPMLPDAFKVMVAWSFEYKTMVTWRKIMALGMGYWFRGQTEHLLLGIRGNVKPFHLQTANFHQSHAQDHSRKPAYFRNLIERAVPNAKRIELFARTKAYGWDSWGNEIDEADQPLEKFAI